MNYYASNCIIPSQKKTGPLTFRFVCPSVVVGFIASPSRWHARREPPAVRGRPRPPWGCWGSKSRSRPRGAATDKKQLFVWWGFRFGFGPIQSSPPQPKQAPAAFREKAGGESHGRYKGEGSVNTIHDGDHGGHVTNQLSFKPTIVDATL